MIVLDGSHGEGGGQILRSALALSLLTRQPFRIENVRANRKKPGLQRQHLMAVKAAAVVGQAEVHGAELHSPLLEFAPREVCCGRYDFDIGSAGSTTLVLQTILPALIVWPQKSFIRIQGGTNNPMAPPIDFIQEAFLPLLVRMGPRIEAHLVQRGFFPRGGGVIEVEVHGVEKLRPIELIERGRIRRVLLKGVVQNLPAHIAQREIQTAREMLPIDPIDEQIDEIKSVTGPGNAFLIEIESETITEMFSAVGERGVRAEEVARHAAKEAKAYLNSGAPVGEHLADQLLLPMALSGAGRFVTHTISSHFETNVHVIRQFLDVTVAIEKKAEERFEVAVSR